MYIEWLWLHLKSDSYLGNSCGILCATSLLNNMERTSRDFSATTKLLVKYRVDTLVSWMQHVLVWHFWCFNVTLLIWFDLISNSQSSSWSIAWMRQWGVNNLPKVVAQQRHGWVSNPRPLDRKSDALPLSHCATPTDQGTEARNNVWRSRNCYDVQHIIKVTRLGEWQASD